MLTNGVQSGAQPLLCMPVPETRPVTAPHIDQWRVFLQQCPDCGEVHGKSGTPDHHVYRYADAAPDDLVCPLCGDPLQAPLAAPCGDGHLFCTACIMTLLSRNGGRAACPLDGHMLTRFALQAPSDKLLKRLGALHVR